MVAVIENSSLKASEYGAIQPQEITTNLFTDFINWIDRSEKTAYTYLKNLKQFYVWLKYSAISKPDRTDIINYRSWLLSEHEALTLDESTVHGWQFRTDKNGELIKVNCKPNTVKQYLQSVRQFFTWTAANGIYPNIAANIHAPKINADEHKKDSLTASDVLQIESSILLEASERTASAGTETKDTAGRIQRSTEQGKRLYAMYLLAVNAGLRTIELSRANIKDLETKGGKTYLYIHGKGRNEADQKKPIVKEVKAAIDDYLKSRSDNYNMNSPLFVSTGNRSKGKRIATTTISTMLKQAMKAAGYDSERLTAHSLRHTTGENVMKITGSNIYKTQMYMRHANPKTTEIYLNNDSSEQDETIATQLYNSYHNTQTDNNTALAENIITIMQGMNAAQLQQLKTLTAALATVTA